jgi:hypothetical protein
MHAMIILNGSSILRFKRNEICTIIKTFDCKLLVASNSFSIRCINLGTMLQSLPVGCLTPTQLFLSATQVSISLSINIVCNTSNNKNFTTTLKYPMYLLTQMLKNYKRTFEKYMKYTENADLSVTWLCKNTSKYGKGYRLS